MDLLTSFLEEKSLFFRMSLQEKGEFLYVVSFLQNITCDEEKMSAGSGKDV